MIPLATTTIAVLRRTASDTADPYEAPAAAPKVIARGVRASIYMSGARSDEEVRGGSQEVRELRLSCDPVDLTHTDQVRDERSGDVYDVTWVQRRSGLNLDHVEAALKTVDGLV